MSTPASLRQAAHILTLVTQKGDDKDRLTDLVETGFLSDLLEATNVRLLDRESFRKFLGLGSLIPEVIILSVDYGMTLEEMIAAGNYDWKNDDLNAKNFPVKGEGIQEFEFDLVDPKGDISSEKALKLLEKDSDPANPWIAGRTEHLLALGVAFPDLQRKNPIVALGSVAGVCGGRRVPCLYNYGSKRYLNLYYFGNDWLAYYRFLRVRRKVSAPVASSPSV